MTPDSPEVLARIKESLELVDQLAHVMRKSMGTFIDVEDLMSTGKEALLKAARTYDSDQGVPFKNYARLKIRGAMIESYRSRGPLPKRVYRKLRALQAGDQVLENLAEEHAAAPPPSAELADERLASVLEGAAAAMAIGMLSMRSVEDMRHGPQDEDDTPEDKTAEVEMLRMIHDAIAERPENEQALIKRHYFDEITFEAAAKEIGLSKSWGSRLHARALEGIARSLKRRNFVPP